MQSQGLLQQCRQGWAATGAGSQHLQNARSVVAHGRRDGRSQQRQPFENRRKTRQYEQYQPMDGPPATAWMDRRDDARDSRSNSSTRDKPGYNSQQGYQDDESQEADSDGWWQRPEERSLQAYAPEQLQPWQTRRLEQAFALGRKKAKIMELANELDLDRAYVIHWLKEFSLKPEAERGPVVRQRLTEVQAGAALRATQQVPQVPQPLLPPQPQPQPPSSGFIPFYTRKEQGLLGDFKHKKLSADAVRTLESIYTRTPFPSNDMIKGLWELHKLSREIAIKWFEARRQQDGLVNSSQRRPPRDDKGGLHMSDGALRSAMGQVGVDEQGLLVRLSEQQDSQQQQQAAQGPPKVVHVNSRQMAVMVSSLPSPNKKRGQKLNEAMGVTHEAGILKMGNVQYVQEAAPPQGGASKWTTTWRARRVGKAPQTLALSVLDVPAEFATQ